jgi:Tfp pilus assembly protein PilV
MVGLILLQEGKMRERMRGERGVSLLEVLVSMGIFSLLLFSLLNMYSLGARTYRHGATQMELQQNARIALYHMDRSFKAMDQFTIIKGQSIEFFYAGNHRKYTYRLRMGELEYVVGTSVTKVAAHMVSLEFFQTSAGVIHVTVTTGGLGKEYVLTSAVKPRNIP